MFGNSRHAAFLDFGTRSSSRRSRLGGRRAVPTPSSSQAQELEVTAQPAATRSGTAACRGSTCCCPGNSTSTAQSKRAGRRSAPPAVSPAGPRRARDTDTGRDTTRAPTIPAQQNLQQRPATPQTPETPRTPARQRTPAGAQAYHHDRRARRDHHGPARGDDDGAVAVPLATPGTSRRWQDDEDDGDAESAGERDASHELPLLLCE